MKAEFEGKVLVQQGSKYTKQFRINIPTAIAKDLELDRGDKLKITIEKEIIMKTRDDLIEEVLYKVEQRVREEYQDNKWVIEIGFDYPAMWDDVLAYPEIIEFETEEERQAFDDDVIFPLVSKIAQEEIEKNIDKL